MSYNMKKIATILLSASILTNIAFAANGDKTLATYKGGEVKESQLMEQIKPAMDLNPSIKGKNFDELDSNTQETLVKGYINAKLLEQEGKNNGLESTPDFQEKLNKAKSQLIYQELIQRYLKANVNDQMIDSEYDKLVANLKGKEEVKVSHILVENEEKAKEVKKKLSKGGKFAALAKEYSKDEGSKANGGEIGFIMKGMLVPEFEDKALSMKVNEISDPVKTQFGWHIIKVLDKRPVKVPTKEEAKSALTNKVNNEAIEKYLSDLSSKADIKLNLPKKEEKPTETK